MTPETKDPIRTLTLSEVAAALRVGKKAVLSMIRAGLPARKVGRAWRIPVSTLNEWLEQKQGETPGQEPEASPARKPETEKA